MSGAAGFGIAVNFYFPRRSWENASPELMATPRRGWGARRHKQNQCSLMHELDQQWLRIYIYIYTHADITVDLLYIVVVAVLAAVVLAVDTR